eukprot:TRINITY_DN1056_c0_g1_i1.p1 TRINITY_DN1056_c0_g1~~TRINITY_DN1056_c0_g1_i1.p1  ORF type:complete len:704 (+),score=75.07 TRINITY_DN1056_c0_g1_i1:35-2146(+)
MVCRLGFFGVIVVLLVSSPNRVRSNCGSRDFDEYEISLVEEKAESLKRSDINVLQGRTEPLIIPTHWHILHDGAVGMITEAQVVEAMNLLNSYYLQLQVGVFFYLYSVNWTDVNVIGHRDWYYMTDRKKPVSPDVLENRMREYFHVGNGREMNVYTLDFTGVTGVSSFPWNLDTEPNYDGIALDINAYYKDTIVHESGHWMGLYHTHQSGCGTGDRVADTPAETGSHDHCYYLQNTDSCPNDPGYDPVDNLMSYGGCRFKFTPGQIARMGEQFTLYRNIEPTVPIPSAPPQSATTGTTSPIGYTTICNVGGENAVVSLACPSDQVIVEIPFASYGTPTGNCALGWRQSGCHAVNSTAVVDSACLGKQSCAVTSTNTIFGDPCSGVAKALVIEAICGTALTTFSLTSGPLTTQTLTTKPLTTRPVTTQPLTTEPLTTQPLTTLDLTTQKKIVTTNGLTTQEFTTRDVTTRDLTTQKITTQDLTTAQVTTSRLTTAEVTSSPLTTAEVTTSPVTSSEITTKEVTTSPITTQAVTTSLVTSQSITTADVTTSPLTTAGVTTSPVTSSEVTTKDATTSPVTTQAVTTSPVTSQSVTTADVTTSRLTTDQAPLPVSTGRTSDSGVVIISLSPTISFFSTEDPFSSLLGSDSDTTGAGATETDMTSGSSSGTSGASTGKTTDLYDTQSSNAVNLLLPSALLFLHVTILV